MTQRLDAALAARGLARSRTQAAALIAQGLVAVDGRQAVKPSLPVSDGSRLEVAATDHYVSRAAHKLSAALDAFGLEVAGRTALDLGASTGGFTQVLRERGADPVIALDVGHGQLAPQVRADPGVVAVEGFNVRDLSPAALTALSGVQAMPEVVTADLSFISLTLVLAPLARTAPRADMVLLVKPQFEVGRTGVREGVVGDPGRRADALARVLWAAWDERLGTAGVIASPLKGTHGNVEFLVHLRVGAPDPSEWSGIVDEVAGVR